MDLHTELAIAILTDRARNTIRPARLASASLQKQSRTPLQAVVQWVRRLKKKGPGPTPEPASRIVVAPERTVTLS